MPTNLMKFKYYATIAKLAIIVGAPIVFLILPADFFDNGSAMCLSKVFFDYECYACGMTRACQHLIHFEFEKAYEYHMLSFLALPALAVVWVQWFFKELKAYRSFRAIFQPERTA
jgi:hypothetical protein